MRHHHRSFMHSVLRFSVRMAAVVFACLAAEPAAAQLTDEDIEALRKRGEAEGWTFTVGHNGATRWSLDQLCGLVKPSDWREGARFDPCTPRGVLPDAFNWCDLGGCTPIKSQGGCGSCWAFAAIGAFESVILIQEGLVVDLSEQWLVSCTDAGSCDGGWVGQACDYHKCTGPADPCGDSGAVLEADFPYTASDDPCDCPYHHPYCLNWWSYIGGGDPTVDQIKQAIYSFGPVAVGVYSNDAFHAYNGGIFNACEDKDTNHVVVLVGWDDNQGTAGVWILRNSWGTDWGEDGYMRIEYECSRVGRYGLFMGGYVGNQNPTIESLSSSPEPVYEGELLTLTAHGVDDVDGDVVLVEFYLDADGDCDLDVGDVLLGDDPDGADGWEVEVDSGVLPGGEIQLMAQACDDGLAWSWPVCTGVEVIPCTGSNPTETEITAADAGEDDQFGWSVAIDGDLAIVGTHWDDDAGGDSGSAYVFDMTTGEPRHKLTAGDAAAGDLFGTSVAINDGLAIVGADGKEAAYVFDAATGQQLHKLTAADGAPGDEFGIAVAISGEIVIVGADHDEHAGAMSGSVYVFDATTGQQLHKLIADDAEEGDRFGCAASVDGNLAIIGARMDDDASPGDPDCDSGSAYVFDVTTGQQLRKLVADDSAPGDEFAVSVSIEGGIAIVGAFYDDDAGADSGALYVFDAQTGQQLHKLTAEDGAAGDYLGWAASISGDLAVAGAPGDDDTGPLTGSAYVFDLTTGQQLRKLTAADAELLDSLGRSVSISGATCLAGAPFDDDAGDDAGSVYVFDWTIIDCNDNGVADTCDLHFGTSEDCNGNNIPDDCDIDSGLSEDCNDNGIPDECDIASLFEEASPELSPFGWGFPQVYSVMNPPEAFSEVTLFFTAYADLNGSAAYAAVDLNGHPVGQVFRYGAWDCPNEPDVDQIIIPAPVFNVFVPGEQDAVITMTASDVVDPLACADPTYITVEISYTGGGPNDCNENGVPDECDIADGTSQDANGNGIPDECECPADFDGDGDVDTADLLILLGAWGTPDGDVDGDGDTDTADLLALLAAWGNCP